MDNKVVYASKKIANGTGSLEVLGLTMEEKRLLMGDDSKTGFALRSGANQPSFALLFAQDKADGGKILNCVYNVKFSPAGLSAISLEEGNVEEQTQTLEFTAIERPNDNIFFYCVDTKEEGAVGVENFFTQVPEPPQA